MRTYLFCTHLFLQLGKSGGAFLRQVRFAESGRLSLPGVCRCFWNLRKAPLEHPLKAHVCFCLKYKKLRAYSHSPNPHFQSAEAHLQFFGMRHHLQLGGVVFVAVGKNQADIGGEAVCVRVLPPLHPSLQRDQSHHLTTSRCYKLDPLLRPPAAASYFDRAEVHGVLDDVVVIVELQSFGVHGLVERPGVRRVLL